MLEKLDNSSLYLVVFGPGYGESIVLRIPPRTWIVVDGCRLGSVSPAAKLLAQHRAAWSCIVLTHRHEDHTIGLDDVLQHEGTGPIGCVTQLVEDPSKWSDSQGTEEQLRLGTTEHVLATINDRWHHEPVTRWEVKQGADRQIGDAVLKPVWPDGDTLSRYRGADENALSAPLLVQWKGVRVLLGADLPTEQWRHVGRSFDDLGNHVCCKLPHHASRNGFSDTFARNRSVGARFWVATPWRLAGGKLPRFEDEEGVDILLRCEPSVHLSSLPSDCDLQGQVPFRATRIEIRDGARPRPVVREVAPGFRLRHRQDFGDAAFSCFVALPIDSAGVVGEPIYGPGATVVTA